MAVASDRPRSFSRLYTFARCLYVGDFDGRVDHQGGADRRLLHASPFRETQPDFDDRAGVGDLHLPAIGFLP